MSYCSIFLFASSRIAVISRKRTVEVSRVAVIAERRVLPFLERGHQPHAVAILRDMGKTLLSKRLRVEPRRGGNLLAMQDDLARCRVADAGKDLEQLRLAVAGDPSDADDLAGADLK